MKRLIKYLIFVALFAAFIIKFTHFNWVLPTIIVAILGLIVLGLLKVNDKLNEIQNKDYQNHNIYLDEDFDDCSDLMDIEVPEPKEIEYYKDTKTTMAEWNFINSFDDPFKGLRKNVNVKGNVGSSFYLVAGSGAEYFVSYEPEIGQYTISRIDQNDDLEGFHYMKTNSGCYRSIEYDKKTNTLFV